ncbi:MAG: O-methyltransferase [Bacteroidales bacterium]
MINKLQKYCLQHSTPEPQLLTELVRETHLRVLQARMLSHWQQGFLLQTLAKILRPKNILEIGTFTGYSALCLAESLPENGSLHTYDVNDEVLEIAKEFVARSLLQEKIFIHHANFLEEAPKLNMSFELVFIDGDKREYIAYYRMAHALVPSGGLIIADNVLWGDKVVNFPLKKDLHTQAILSFNKMIVEDSSVEVLMLPLRDGLSIIRKK